MKIKCNDWKNTGEQFKGECTLGMFKGNPTFGNCVNQCAYCGTKWPELNAYMRELAGQPPKNKNCSNCGKTKAIIKGLGKLIYTRIFKTEPTEQEVERAETCSNCEHRTFLNAIEWGVGFVKEGDLPINHKPGDWDALWCSKCKCCIEAKIRVKDEQCPEGKW